MLNDLNIQFNVATLCKTYNVITKSILRLAKINQICKKAVNFNLRKRNFHHIFPKIFVGELLFMKDDKKPKMLYFRKICMLRIESWQILHFSRKWKWHFRSNPSF